MVAFESLLKGINLDRINVMDTNDEEGDIFGFISSFIPRIALIYVQLIRRLFNIGAKPISSPLVITSSTERKVGVTEELA